jgi:curved DNA-binding protein CbpA
MANDLSLSGSDMWMAASNAMQLGSYYVLKKAVESGDRDQHLPALVVAVPLLIGGGIINSLANWWMLPRDASLLRKIISFPFPATLNIKGHGLGFFGKIKEVSNLYTVAQNTLPKLANCARNLTTRPIRALSYGAVHAFNLGSEVFSVGTSFGLFGKSQDSSSKQPESEPKQNPSGSSKPQTEQPRTSNFEKQDDISRFTDPRLNPKSLKDAQKMFQLPNQKVDPQACRQYGYSYIRETCDSICSTIKKTWKEISLGVHPDKNPSPLATEASQNLNIAKETLASAYNC